MTKEERKIKVTYHPKSKSYTLEGLAYEADKPNVNGNIYPLDVLKKAFEEFMVKKPEDRLVCDKNTFQYPSTGNSIGFVQNGRMKNGKVFIAARTWNDDLNFKRMEKNSIAFAGCGEGELIGKSLKSFEDES